MYIYIYIAIYGLNIWIKYGLAIKTKAYKENGQLDDWRILDQQII